jgi:hypothetical protein
MRLARRVEEVFQQALADIERSTTFAVPIDQGFLVGRL